MVKVTLHGFGLGSLLPLGGDQAPYVALSRRFFPPPKGGFSNNRGGTWVPELETGLVRWFLELSLF